MGCLRTDPDDLERLARAGRGDRLAEVVTAERTSAELRATAASLLLLSGDGGMALVALTRLPPDRRVPVVAYLLNHFLPRALSESPERGRRALLLVRPYGAPEDVIRADRLLLDSVSAELKAATPGAPLRRTTADVLLSVGPGHPERVLAMLELPGAPRDLMLRLLAGHPQSLSEARARLLERLQGGEAPDAQLWRTLAEQGLWRPLLAKLGEGGKSAQDAAEALLAAPRDEELAASVLRLLRQRDLAPDLRAPLLGVLERVGSAEVVPELMKILRRERETSFGYRLYLAVVVLGGAKAALPALEAFPASVAHDALAVRRHLVRGTRLLGAGPAREIAISGLRSSSPLARLTAILLLEHVGTPADAPLLRRLTGQRARPRGLGPDDSIGVQASRVRVQLETGSAPASAGTPGA